MQKRSTKTNYSLCHHSFSKMFPVYFHNEMEFSCNSYTEHTKKRNHLVLDDRSALLIFATRQKINNHDMVVFHFLISVRK